MFSSYHVHSNLSDGTTDIESMILAGIGAGLVEIGISDHLLLLPDNEQVNWSMNVDQLPGYVDKLIELREKYSQQIKVRLGLEADYQPQTLEYLKDILDQYPFDYVIGSVHVANGFPIDNIAEDWQNIDQDQRNQVVIDYWTLEKEMVQSGVYDIAAHLDLHKKFAYLPTIDVSSMINDVLDAIADSGMVVELNTSGWYKPIAEQYPSDLILLGCRERGIPIILSADAHEPAHVNRDFARAKKLLEGYHISPAPVITCRNNP